MNYLLLVSFGLILFYIPYQLFIQKRENFKNIRFFVLASLFLSIILPLFPIHYPWHNFNEFTIIRLTQEYGSANTNLIPLYSNNKIEFLTIIKCIYLFVSIFLAGRFVFSLVKVIYYIRLGEKKKYRNFTFVFIDRQIDSFSFFRWIFIPKSEQNQFCTQIIEHEKIHAQQYHSIDILLSEIMVAAMWFNPVIWMYRNALRQIHEFLADEGVIKSGVNPVEYQSLLVNQAAEGRLVAISSNFSYSLIKKRLVMISEKKKRSNSGVKMLFLLPIAAIVLTGVSVQKGYSENSLNKVNTLTASSNKHGHSDMDEVSKNDLIKKGELVLELDETNFSQAFKVISFTVSATIKGFEESYDQTNGPKFTKQQIDLIRRVESGKKLYIENIKALGPEGEIRNLGTIVFIIR